MRLLEDRILRIIELRSSGFDETQIASSMNLTPELVLLYENNMRRSIDEVVKEGDNSIIAISKEVGISPIVIGRFMECYYKQELQPPKPIRRKKREFGNDPLAYYQEHYPGVTRGQLKKQDPGLYARLRRDGLLEHVPLGRRGRPSITDQKISVIEQALAESVDSLEELCRRSGLSPSSLISFAYSNNLTIPYDTMKPYGTNPNIDSLIPLGLTQVEIANKVGVSKAYIELYLKATGQKGIWKAAKKEKKGIWKAAKKEKAEQEEAQKKQPYQHLVNALNAILQERVRDDWPTQKALEYIRPLKTTIPDAISFERLITVYKIYYDAQQSGNKISLEEMGDAVGLYPIGVSRLLKRVGLEPLYGTRERKTIPNSKKDEIARAYDTDLSLMDIAYFLGLEYFNVQVHKPSTDNQGRYKGYIGPYRLSYRMASQILEACDLGFTIEEVAELIDTKYDKKKVVESALSNRQELEPRIISQLRVIWPDKAIEKPYL